VSSGKRRFAMRPGGGLVVPGAGLRSSVQDADELVGESPEHVMMLDAPGAEGSVEGADGGRGVRRGEDLCHCHGRVEGPIVADVPGGDDVLLTQGAGDRAGDTIVLAGVGRGVRGGIVAGFAEHPRAEHHADAGLGQVDLSIQASVKMPLHLPLQVWRFDQQLQGARGGQVFKRFQRGGEVLPQMVPQPLDALSAFPDLRLAPSDHHLGGLRALSGRQVPLAGVGAPYPPACAHRRHHSLPRTPSPALGTGMPAAGSPDPLHSRPRPAPRPAGRGRSRSISVHRQHPYPGAVRSVRAAGPSPPCPQAAGPYSIRHSSCITSISCGFQPSHPGKQPHLLSSPRCWIWMAACGKPSAT
jgi:hypothetical protein